MPTLLSVTTPNGQVSYVRDGRRKANYSGTDPEAGNPGGTPLQRGIEYTSMQSDATRFNDVSAANAYLSGRATALTHQTTTVAS